MKVSEARKKKSLKVFNAGVSTYTVTQNLFKLQIKRYIII